MLFEQLEGAGVAQNALQVSQNPSVDTAPEDDEEGPTDSLTAAVASKLARERAAQAALHDANAALQRHMQRLQDQLAAQQAQHAEREGQLLACLSQTTRAHSEAMQRLGKDAHMQQHVVDPDALVRPLCVGTVVEMCV